MHCCLGKNELLIWASQSFVHEGSRSKGRTASVHMHTIKTWKKISHILNFNTRQWTWMISSTDQLVYIPPQGKSPWNPLKGKVSQNQSQVCNEEKNPTTARKWIPAVNPTASHFTEWMPIYYQWDRLTLLLHALIFVWWYKKYANLPWKCTLFYDLLFSISW
jgi:hypothetical protein